VPIDLRTQTDDVILLLYGTGIRARSDLRNVKVTIGQEECEVLYAGPQGEFPGLDQVNVRLPRALLGKDIVSLTLTADGKASNVVTLEMGGRPRISGLTPRMVEVGASNADVVISGEYLTGVTRLQFDSAAGITVSELRVVSDTEVRAKVTITAEARVGDRPFRAVSPAGTSDRFNFIVRPRPGSNAPFIYNVTAGLTLVGLNLAGVSGSFDFEDADGDIRWTGALQTSARVRVSGPSCTATGSGAYLDFAGRNSGRVNYVVTWSPGGLSFGNFSASLVLIDAAGNQSAAYIWEPGGWWGC
jgi:hypothetical protein